MKEKLEWVKHKGVLITGIALAVYLGMKYIVPLVIPFFIAWGVAVLIHPYVRKLNKLTHINQGVIAGLVLLVLGGSLGTLLWIVVARLLQQLGKLLGNIDFYQYQLNCFIRDCCNALELRFGIDAYAVESLVLENVEVLVEEMHVTIVPRVMNYSFLGVKYIVGGFALTAVTIISIILLSKDYERIREDCRRLLGYTRIVRIGRNILNVGVMYLKAQLTIMLLTSVIAAGTFALLGNSYALLIGVTIGLLDALPFIGTGSILVPWSLITLIQGDLKTAIYYMILYGVLSLMREFLEPKLIGKKLGIYPIVVLAAVYIGLRLYGALGILLGPLTFLLIYEIGREAGVFST